MLDVFPHRMLGPLYTHKVLVSTLSTLNGDPVELLVALVFISLDEIPSEDEVFRYIIDAIPNYAQCNIMPWHASILSFAQFIVFPVVYTFEVHDAIIVEVLAGPDFLGSSYGMNICQWMLMIIPSTKA